MSRSRVSQKRERMWMGLVAGFAAVLLAVPQARADLISNGGFATDLSGWKSEGTVASSAGSAELVEGSTAPVLYQALSVSGYAYELRFDVYLGDLSSATGEGQLDRAQMILYVGTAAASLTPDSAADESILIEADVKTIDCMKARSPNMPMRTAAETRMPKVAKKLN